MNSIRVKHVPDFKYEDVVLLAMDRAGLADFLAAIVEAQRRGSALLQRRHRSHSFAVEAGSADITLTDGRVVWQLDRGVVDDIIVKLTVLRDSDGPGHHYVDEMNSPASTLVLSLDEYIAPSWLTEGKEPIFGDEPE